jgi:hypothetical protein
MTQADRIRQFVLDQFIAPARQQGRPEVVIRAGDVHQQMSLTNAMPAVCGAIGGSKFEHLAAVTKSGLRGPSNGANAYFTFNLSARPSAIMVVKQREAIPTSRQSYLKRDLDLSGAVVLVSCVKSKLSHSATARTLYTSAWFQKVRNIIEASGERWFVLSALYGLVTPDTEIAPYDYTLNTVGVADRKAWAARVLDRLLPEMVREKRVVMFAGQRYREFLIEPLRQHGIEVDIPMAHLLQGQQLNWLSEH